MSLQDYDTVGCQADGDQLAVLRSRLIDWWKLEDREDLFPWRKRDISPYRALVTEVLLQRTRAEAVGQIYSKFFTLFRDAEMLCSADVNKIKEIIKPLGLTWRAVKLKELGCKIKNGIPEVMEELLKLPGVGLYVAGAFLSLHRDLRAIIPDANMVRILGRVFGLNVTAELRRKKWFLLLCNKVTPVENFREFNYAILDLGREVCKPVKPECNLCCLNGMCDYFNGKRD